VQEADSQQACTLLRWHVFCMFTLATFAVVGESFEPIQEHDHDSHEPDHQPRKHRE
jgi:hypothetical protein